MDAGPRPAGAQSVLARYPRSAPGARLQPHLRRWRRRRMHRDRSGEQPPPGRQRFAQRHRESRRLLIRRQSAILSASTTEARTMANDTFPIDLGKLQPLKLDPAVTTLTDEQKATLKHNIQLCRDTIVFITALAGAKGLSGHTGGAYDTVPEMMIVRAFIANGAPIVPVFYDEAGHRVATQYLLSVLQGAMPAEKLLHYREFGAGLPGHPEKGLTPGVEFSSGR